MIDDRLKKVFTAIFGISEKNITEESSVDNVQGWDSIKHLNLIVSLEEEFNIEFDEEEFAGLTSFKSIKELISSRSK